MVASKLYKVLPGENYESIAKKIYGDETLAAILWRMNKQAVLHPGMRIRVQIQSGTRKGGGAFFKAQNQLTAAGFQTGYYSPTGHPDFFESGGPPAAEPTSERETATMVDGSYTAPRISAFEPPVAPEPEKTTPPTRGEKGYKTTPSGLTYAPPAPPAPTRGEKGYQTTPSGLTYAPSPPPTAQPTGAYPSLPTTEELGMDYYSPSRGGAVNPVPTSPTTSFTPETPSLTAFESGQYAQAITASEIAQYTDPTINPDYIDYDYFMAVLLANGYTPDGRGGLVYVGDISTTPDSGYFPPAQSWSDEDIIWTGYGGTYRKPGYRRPSATSTVRGGAYTTNLNTILDWRIKAFG